MLVHVQTFWAADLPAVGQAARIVETVGSDGQPDLIIFNAGSQSYMTLDLSAPLAAAAQMSEVVLRANALAHWVPMSTGNMRVDSFALDAAQTQSESVATFLARNPFVGNDAGILRYDQGGASFFVVSRPTGDGLSVYRMTGTRDFVLVQTIDDVGNLALSGVTATCIVTVGGNRFVIAGSQYDSGMTVLSMSATGSLTPVFVYGAAQGVPVRYLTDLEVVELGGVTYVISAAAGTSSVSVMRVDSTGALHLTDHLTDTRDTRFGGATALDTIRIGAEVFVAVAGGDGGITLLQVLPGGRLIVRDVLEDGLNTALNGVRQVEFVEVAGRVELFVVSNEGGISRYRVETGPAGIEATGLLGSAGNDVLTAPNARGEMLAGTGADVLIAGPAQDTLRGGSGADLFIMESGGPTDTIADFEPGVDRIDLSRFASLRELSDLVIVQRPNGASIMIGSEEIRIISANGRPLDAGQVREGLIINEGSGGMPSAVPQPSAPGVGQPPPTAATATAATTTTTAAASAASAGRCLSMAVGAADL